MRKIVSLGLFALMLSIFSGQALAGDITACEDLRDEFSDIYEPNLYGLCIAWHNADEHAKDRIAGNYSKRSGGDTVPGSVAPKSGQDFYCPCWDTLTYDEVGTAIVNDEFVDLTVSLCVADGSLANDVIRFNGSGVTQLFGAGTSQEKLGCGYIFYTSSNGINMVSRDDLLEEEMDNCRVEVQGIALAFPDDCTNP